MSNYVQQFSLRGRHHWREICNRMVATQEYPKFGFKMRGQDFLFATREQYDRATNRVPLIAQKQQDFIEGRITYEDLMDCDWGAEISPEQDRRENWVEGMDVDEIHANRPFVDDVNPESR